MSCKRHCALHSPHHHPCGSPLCSTHKRIKLIHVVWLAHSKTHNHTHYTLYIHWHLPRFQNQIKMFRLWLVVCQCSVWWPDIHHQRLRCMFCKCANSVFFLKHFILFLFIPLVHHHTIPLAMAGCMSPNLHHSLPGPGFDCVGSARENPQFVNMGTWLIYCML